MLGNEFNALQTMRITSPAFTLLMMVRFMCEVMLRSSKIFTCMHLPQCLILVGNEVIVSGDITPYGQSYTVYQNNVSSTILRFGTEAAFFLVLFLGQVRFFILLLILLF